MCLVIEFAEKWPRYVKLSASSLPKNWNKRLQFSAKCRNSAKVWPLIALKDQQSRTSASAEPKRRNIGRRIDAHLSRSRRCSCGRKSKRDLDERTQHCHININQMRRPKRVKEAGQSTALGRQQQKLGSEEGAILEVAQRSFGERSLLHQPITDL